MAQGLNLLELFVVIRRVAPVASTTLPDLHADGKSHAN
jgi:hypothetical protein